MIIWTRNFVSSVYREIVRVVFVSACPCVCVHYVFAMHAGTQDYSRETGGDLSELRTCPAICATNPPWDYV